MTNHGLIRVAAAIPEVKVADCSFNAAEIRKMIDKAVARGIQFVCFPELSVTGYTCGDLFQQQLLIEQAEIAVRELLETTNHLDIIFIIGTPLPWHGKLFNTALVCQKGNILGIVPKTYLPNYNEFYEKRWFVSGADPGCSGEVVYAGQHVPFCREILFRSKEDEKIAFAVELCEDLWAPVPVSSDMAMHGASFIFNISASNELTGKNDYLKSLVQQQSARCIAGYIYASAGWGESTTDLVFAGNGFICENGIMLAQSERFLFEEQLVVSEIDIERLLADRQRISSFEYKCTENDPCIAGFSMPEADDFHLTRRIEPQPFVPSGDAYDERCREIFSIQIGGLAKRLMHTGIKKAVVGVSGGLDSTLALLVCAGTLDKLKIARENIIGITMPGYGTTGRTRNNALQLMQSLGITIREIDITAACDQHFRDIGHDASTLNVTFENVQARERMQILMDIANQENGLVVGTGDMSELALGWATYNGDHMSMYAVNTSIPKTLVRHLVRWIADTRMDDLTKAVLTDVLDTPVSPELLPAGDDGEIIQRTEDVVGPYVLHDFFLYYVIRFGFAPRKILFLAEHAFAGVYDGKTIRQWMKVFYRRFFSQQFKRSCIPDGPKVGSINLSPRGDWRMPSDASANLWLKDLD